MPTNDDVLRGPVVQGNMTLELAIGGNLTQWRDSNGNALTSILPGTSADTGYPVTKVIDGWEPNYDPTTDTDTAYWRSPSGAANNDLIIDLGMVQTFNQLVMYQHATLPSLSGVRFDVSLDNITYTTVYSQAISLSQKVIANVSQQTARYIKMHPLNYGADSTLRICEILVFNWVDITNDLVMMGETPDGEPDLHLTQKGTSGQNALPTATELQFTLQNAENKYSPWNSASPYYGIQGPDGMGTGIRPQIRVRLSVNPTSSQATFTNQIFYGIVANDNNPGGSDGVDFSSEAEGQSRTTMFVCKSILYRLDTIINAPTYDNATAAYVIHDICQRCGISILDVGIGTTFQQGVPLVAFPQGPGINALNAYAQAMPFMRIYEQFNSPDWFLNCLNHGRTKQNVDLTLGGMGGGGNASPNYKNIRNVLNFNGSQTFVFDNNSGNGGAGTHSGVWLWDQSKPTSLGMSLYGTNVAFDNAMAYYSFVNIYFVDSTGAVKHFDPSLSSLGAITTDGTFAGIDAGFNFLKTAVFSGQFLYVVMGNNASTTPASGTHRLYVWDITQAFATRVSKGVIPQIELPQITAHLSSQHPRPSGVFVDDKYFGYKADSSFFVNRSTLILWKHNGTPYATALTTVTTQFFSANAIAGESYDNHMFTYGANNASPRLIMIGVSVLHAADSLFRMELWSFDVDVAYATPATTATKRGVIKDNTSSTVVQYGAGTPTPGFVDSGCMAMNGSYVYIGDSEFNLWTWDTNKNFSFLFQLGFNMPTFPGQYMVPYAPCYQTFVQMDSSTKLMGRHVGPLLNDFYQAVWFASYNPITEFNDTLVGFTLALSSAFPDPLIFFDIQDGFVENLQLNIGNPTCNRILLQPSPYVIQSTSFLWNQPAAPMLFPSNQKTTLPFQLNGMSYRGVASVKTGLRYFHCSTFSTNIVDSPTTVTVVNINGVNYNITFFAYADIGYLTIDCTGGKGSVSISGGYVYGQPVSQPYSASGYIDQSDLISQAIYQRIIQQSINTPLFNDTSFYQDILLNGKFQKPYIQGQDMPWYPNMGIGTIIGVQDTVLKMPLTNFEIVEMELTGYKTKFKANVVQPTFNI